MEEDLKKVCRLCSHIRKHLRPMSEKVGNLTYSDIIYKITNIKIIEEDKLPNTICTSCRIKARAGHEFAEMVERTDNELKRKAGVTLKRIKFNNVQDIKVEIEIKDVKVKPEKTEKMDDYSNIVCLDFLEDEDLVINDTTIKKVQTDSGFDYDQNKDSQLSVGDFLNAFKADDDDIDYNDCDINVEPVQDSYSERDSDDDCKYRYKKKRKKTDDDDYVPPVKKQYPQKKNKRRTNTQRKWKVLEEPIKPTVVKHKDIKVVSTKFTIENTDGKRMQKKELCPYCGKYVYYLPGHILQHTGERNHKCDLCPKSFYTGGGLNAHKKKHFKTLHCQQCTGVFPNEGDLKRHMLSHTNIRNYVCDICNKGFKTRNVWLRHTKSHSVANKIVQCELCSMSFFEKCKLRAHMRTHTGERPYKCELCNQPYSYKRDFDRHCINKHGVFFKGRSENVLNEEVIIREKALMKQLYLRTKGVVIEGEPLNPFTGRYAPKTYQLALNAIKNNIIPIESIIDS